MTDYSLTKELRYALAAYLDAREGWRLAVEVIEEQFEAKDPGSGGLDPNNERVLYQAARARYLGKAGELREGGVRDELTHRARLYLTEFGRLSNALDNPERPPRDDRSVSEPQILITLDRGSLLSACSTGPNGLLPSSTGARLLNI